MRLDCILRGTGRRGIRLSSAVIVFCVAACASNVGVGPSPSRRYVVDQADHVELIQLQRRWQQSYVLGRRAELEELLTPDFSVVRSFGDLLDRKGAIRQYENRPLADVSFIPSNERVRLYGDAAIVTNKLLETDRGFRSEFQITDTFIRRNGAWKLAASHWTRVSEDVPELTVDADRLEQVTGSYRRADGSVFRVRRSGNRLMISRPNGQVDEFIAASDSIFVLPVMNVRWVFVRAGDRATHAVIIGSGLPSIVQRIAD